MDLLKAFVGKISATVWPFTLCVVVGSRWQSRQSEFLNVSALTLLTPNKSNAIEKRNGRKFFFRRDIKKRASKAIRIRKEGGGTGIMKGGETDSAFLAKER